MSDIEPQPPKVPELDIEGRLARIAAAQEVLAGLAVQQDLSTTLPSDLVTTKVQRISHAGEVITENKGNLQQEDSGADIPLMPMDSARSSLVTEHIDLVRHIVYQVAVHFPRHVDRDDLAGAARMGLVQAALHFDDTRGVPFEKFAAQRIRGAILDHTRAEDWAPRSVRQTARAIESAEQHLARELGRSPTNRELAERLEVPTGDVEESKKRTHDSVLLALQNAVTDDADEDLTLGDVLADRKEPQPDDVLEERELHALLHDAVQALPERHRQVITRYFFDGLNLLEISRTLGVTESRVSQIKTEGLDMLSRGVEAQYGYNEDLSEGSQTKGRIAKRRRGYAGAIAKARPWRERLSAQPSDAVEIAD